MQSQAAKERLEAAKSEHPMVSPHHAQDSRSRRSLGLCLSGMSASLIIMADGCIVHVSMNSTKAPDACASVDVQTQGLWSCSQKQGALMNCVCVCTGPLQPAFGTSHGGMGMAAAPGQQAYQSQQQRQWRTFKRLNSGLEDPIVGHWWPCICPISVQRQSRSSKVGLSRAH